METLHTTPHQAIVSIAKNQDYIIDVAPFADILSSDAGTDPVMHARFLTEIMDNLLISFNEKNPRLNYEEFKRSYSFLRTWRNALSKMKWTRTK